MLTGAEEKIIAICYYRATILGKSRAKLLNLAGEKLFCQMFLSHFTTTEPNYTHFFRLNRYNTTDAESGFIQTMENIFLCGEANIPSQCSSPVQKNGTAKNPNKHNCDAVLVFHRHGYVCFSSTNGSHLNGQIAEQIYHALS